MDLEIKSNVSAPVGDGRYLCFVSHDLERGTALPIILTWHDGAWHLPYNMVVHKAPVYGWAGPLPVGRCAQLFPDVVSEAAFKSTGIKPTSEYRRDYSAAAQKLSDDIDRGILSALEYDL